MAVIPIAATAIVIIILFISAIVFVSLFCTLDATHGIKSCICDSFFSLFPCKVIFLQT